MTDCKEPPDAVLALARYFSQPKPMRRGTFSEQYLRCNRPGCHCADDETARHGPYYRVVRVVNGKTKSRHVPIAQAEMVRQQVEAGQEFRRQVEAYWEACEQWADGQLDAIGACSQERGSKKKPSSNP